MESIKKLLKIGFGPSSSHTMGPYDAAKSYLKIYPNGKEYICNLYGSLAATGKGHLTDYIVNLAFEEQDKTILINFLPDTIKEKHPNALDFSVVGNDASTITYYSIGGGKVVTDDTEINTEYIYPHKYLRDIVEYCNEKNMRLVDYVYEYEPDIKEYLNNVFVAMSESVDEGLATTGILPGGIELERSSQRFWELYKKDGDYKHMLFAYAFAVAEQNAGGGKVVTAPTCGASGVIPSLLRTYQDEFKYSKDELIDALGTAALFGNVVKRIGSISGAEVGCQGEIGVASAMGAAFVACLYKAGNSVIEHAAEIALEHSLGMTCDPVLGLVQIPCIERNAIAAGRSIDSAKLAVAQKGVHLVSFDTCVVTMAETGRDLHSKYRETSVGGLAINWKSQKHT